MDLSKLKLLYEKKAKIYEHHGKEHLPIEIEKKYSGNDICSHLHCEIVELWLAVKLNQSIEQIIDELADILCIWNLAIVLYEDSSKEVIYFEKIVDNAIEQIKSGEILNLHADPKKDWKLGNNGNALFDSLVEHTDAFLRDQKIEIAYNFGQGIEVDIFGLLHNSVNNLWNAIRKNEQGYSQILNEITQIFATWIVAIRLISKYLNRDISIVNIIEISESIFKKVAKKKFNIEI